MKAVNVLDEILKERQKISSVNKPPANDTKVVYKQRSSKRLPYKNEIEVLANSGDFITGTIINMSQNGMCITSDSDMPTGTRISARIFLGSKICELEGSIRWSSKISNDKGFRVGLELDKLPDDLNDIYRRINKKFAVPENVKKGEKDYTEILHI